MHDRHVREDEDSFLRPVIDPEQLRELSEAYPQQLEHPESARRPGGCRACSARSAAGFVAAAEGAIASRRQLASSKTSNQTWTM